MVKRKRVIMKNTVKESDNNHYKVHFVMIMVAVVVPLTLTTTSMSAIIMMRKKGIL